MFEYNQKVVPLRKSVWGNLDESAVWNRAKKKGQPYLFFKRADIDGEYYICGENMYGYGGDFFNLDDLIPYVEGKSQLNDKEQLSLRSMSLLVVSKYANDVATTN